MLQGREEALRILDVESTAIDRDGQRRVQTGQRRLVFHRAQHQVVLALVVLHPFGVGYTHIQHRIAGLCTEVSHHRQVHLQLIRARRVRQHDFGIGKVGLTRKRIACVREDLEVRQHRLMRNIAQVKVGILQYRTLQIVRSRVLALPFLVQQEDELHRQGVRERPHVYNRHRPHRLEDRRSLVRMRHRGRAHIRVVHVDLQRALIRQRNPVVPVAHMEPEILLAVVEVGRQPHIGPQRNRAIALQIARLGNVANMGDLVCAQPARSIVRLAWRRHLQRRNAHLVALEEVSLQSERSRGNHQVVRIVAGQHQHLRIRIHRIGPHRNRRPRARTDLQRSRQLRTVLADHNRVASRNRPDRHRKPHRTKVRQNPEPRGDDTRRLQGLRRRRAQEDDGDHGMQVDRLVVERQRQQLQIILQGQQRPRQLNRRSGIDMAPQRRMRRVFAAHRVMPDKLEGQLILVDQHLRRHRQRRLQQGVVFVAGHHQRLLVGRLLRRSQLPLALRRRLRVHSQRREERPVQAHLQVAQRGNQAGRKVVPDMHRRGLHHLRLRNREIHRVVRIHAPQHDRIGDSDVGKIEDVVEAPRRHRPRHYATVDHRSRHRLRRIAAYGNGIRQQLRHRLRAPQGSHLRAERGASKQRCNQQQRNNTCRQSASRRTLLRLHQTSCSL